VNGRRFTAAVASHHALVLATNGDATMSTLGLIVVSIQESIGREDLQRIPLIERVADGFAQVALGEHQALHLCERSVKCILSGRLGWRISNPFT
jgi:hypothetical protein